MRGNICISVLAFSSIIISCASCGCGGDRYEHYSNESKSEYYYKEYRRQEDRANKAQKAAKKHPHDSQYYKSQELINRIGAEQAKEDYERAKAEEKLQKERERSLK